MLEHIRRLVNDEIIRAPAIDGAFVLTTRGGDFGLYIGQDISIGDSSHSDEPRALPSGDPHVPLLTTEAAVALSPAC